MSVSGSNLVTTCNDGTTSNAPRDGTSSSGPVLFFIVSGSLYSLSFRLALRLRWDFCRE